MNISGAFAQKTVQEMSKTELMELTYDDLLNLEFEQLLFVANKFEMSAEELMEFFLNKDVSIASKKSETSFESPLSTTVITKEEIQQAGLVSIPQIFRLVPGMIVREKTNGNFDVHIRGNDNLPPANVMMYSENLTTLVMIDGRIVYNYGFGGTMWEAFPIDVQDIERVEIVRGPSSALYGPNAVSGVINFITKKTEDKKLHINLNSYNGVNSNNISNLNNTFSGSASIGFGKLKTRISGNYQGLTRDQQDIYYWFPMTSQQVANPTNIIASGYHPMSYIDYFSMGSFAPRYENGVFEQVPQKVMYENWQDFYSPNSLATEKGGVNARFDYELNTDINFSLSSGYQNSRVMTTVLDDSNVPMTRRGANSSYVDFTAKIHGLDIQVNDMAGWYDVHLGRAGISADINNFNAVVEYGFEPIKNLTVRPGFNYQQASLDDSKYPGTDWSNSLFRKKEIFTDYSASIRLDYLIFNKLRLATAIRGDKYNMPKDPYLSYQFLGSYQFNEKNILRFVYSRSNNSPFFANSSMDHYWQKVPVIAPIFNGVRIQFEGNENLKMTTMDMLEVGYKFKINKFLMGEIEGFYTKYYNINGFYVDSIHVATPINLKSPYTDYILLKYQNLDMISYQKGVTLNINIALNTKSTLRLFGTFQQTDVSDYYPLSIDTTVKYMVKNVIVNEVMKTNAQQTNNGQYDYTAYYTQTQNKSTPKFYGGFVFNYSPTEKWNFNSSAYSYSQQTFVHKNGTSEINPKMIVNATVSYNLYKKSKIYLSCHNILHNDEIEFAFMDRIGARYYLGFNLNF